MVACRPVAIPWQLSPAMVRPASIYIFHPESAVLLLGGKGESDEVIPSAEMFGISNFTFPEMARHGHAVFIWRGNLVTCGGRDQDASISLTCLVLPPAGEAWLPAIVSNTTGRREAAQVVKLLDGVFLLGTTSTSNETGDLLTSEFLPETKSTWQEGPTLPTAAVGGCAVALSDHRFIIAGFFGIREFDAAVGGPSNNDGWLPTARWPSLKEQRSNAACASIGQIVVVAGGSKNHEFIDVTEIIDKQTRTVRQGPRMVERRSMFSLVGVGLGASRKLVALGGSLGERGDGVEEFLPALESWHLQPVTLGAKRTSYGATSLQPAMACEDDLPQTDHGYVHCLESYRPVGTKCTIKCYDLQGYRLKNNTNNYVICGWDSAWITSGQCGECTLIFLYLIVFL